MWLLRKIPLIQKKIHVFNNVSGAHFSFSVAVFLALQKFVSLCKLCNHLTQGSALDEQLTLWSNLYWLHLSKNWLFHDKVVAWNDMCLTEDIFGRLAFLAFTQEVINYHLSYVIKHVGYIK